MTPRRALIVLGVLTALGIGAVTLGGRLAKEQRQQGVADRYQERVRELQAYGISTRPEDD
jgi:hypothetical protein